MTSGRAASSLLEDRFSRTELDGRVALVRREYSYVVELPSMKILNVYVGTTDGSKPNGVSSSLKEAMDQVLALLGNKSG